MNTLKNIARNSMVRLVLTLAIVAIIAISGTGCDDQFWSDFECGFNAGAMGLPLDVCG